MSHSNNTTRNPLYNQNRSFKRGEVFMVDFPVEPELGGEPSRLLEGPHRVVVLYDSTYPRKTVVVVPITSLYDDAGNRKPLILSDVVLYKQDYDNAAEPYNGTIKKDSFIKTNQVRSISRNYLEGKKGELLPKDMLKLDMALISTLGLQDTVRTLIEKALQDQIAQKASEEE